MLQPQIEQALTTALAAVGLEDDHAVVTFSDRPDLCDFQTNCAFTLAKKARTSPMAIAEKICGAFALPDVTADFVRPGFINFTVAPALLCRDLAAIFQDDRCGIPLAIVPRRILIDYGGPNIAKPLHVGHMRSAVIGDCLKRLLRFLGHDVIGDIHLGDWGKQMGLVILGLLERYDLSGYFSENIPAQPPFSVEDLSAIYPETSAKSKTDAAFNAKAMEITTLLQKHERGYYALWEAICRLSVEDIQNDYARLGITFDLWYGESTADPYVAPMLAKMINEGLATESEGALVLEIAEESDTAPMPPVLLRKSDGAQIYASTDLATLVQRMEQFAPDEIWYVVDGRQKLHFQQVFRAARKARLVPKSTALYHIPFGTVNGTDGKPYKTREGGVMRLQDLVGIVTQGAAAKVVLDDDDGEIARKIGVSALKFGDLINNRNKDYVFDIEKFVQFDGKTGPYLQYTVARIHSLLGKCETTLDINGSFHFDEAIFRQIVMDIYKLNSAYELAFAEKLPNYICEACYTLANSFNEFYGKFRILNEENAARKQAMLLLCHAVRKCLLQVMGILGIDPVEHM
ncbi:MAG: arginine--tRNA ligase [Oscillospiraceae bacterium]|jgi:arginyl-tRNA synthetase|nr:arginine--tRNA ligase [Oscillospiraceae bacterium]